MGLKSKLEAILAWKNTLADNIVTKGGEATQSEGMATLVPKVAGLPSIQIDGVTLVEGTTSFDPLCMTDVNYSYRCWKEEKAKIKSLHDTKTTNIADGYKFAFLTSCEEMEFDELVSVTAVTPFGSITANGTPLKSFIAKKLSVLNSTWPFRGVQTLEYLEFGTLTKWGTKVVIVGTKLRNIVVGQGTDIDLTESSFPNWTCTDVIAEGKDSCLELIDNARTGLLERVADHSTEGLVRTITCGWVAALSESEDEDIQDALNALMDDFTDKGWNLQG